MTSEHFLRPLARRCVFLSTFHSSTPVALPPIWRRPHFNQKITKRTPSKHAKCIVWHRAGTPCLRPRSGARLVVQAPARFLGDRRTTTTTTGKQLQAGSRCRGARPLRRPHPACVPEAQRPRPGQTNPLWSKITPGIAGLAAGSPARRPALNEIREFRKTMPRPRRGSELVFGGPRAAKSSCRCHHTHPTTGNPHVSRMSV
jgi:hypothetical protein